jgi:hypothetical protein
MIDKSKFTEIIDGIWYENDTGLPWSNRLKKGYRSETIIPFTYKDKDGYFIITIDKKKVRWHRLVYEHFNGIIIKDKVIDHKNNIVEDNRYNNLQELSVKENTRKRRNLKNNKLPMGVYWHKIGKAFAAQIKINYKSLYLGLFKTAAEVYEAYLQAKIKYHGAESIAPLNNKEK